MRYGDFFNLPKGNGKEIIFDESLILIKKKKLRSNLLRSLTYVNANWNLKGGISFQDQKYFPSQEYYF